jgi:hypothetical protein
MSLAYFLYYYILYIRKEEGTWDRQRRDGGTNSTLRIKEQEKHLTLNEHDDDDDDDNEYIYTIFLSARHKIIHGS